jgi:hypothetical protein
MQEMIKPTFARYLQDALRQRTLSPDPSIDPNAPESGTMEGAGDVLLKRKQEHDRMMRELMGP